MKSKSNVTNRELVGCLLESVKFNDDAIDYIQNRIFESENFLGFCPDNVSSQNQLKIEKYILHCLFFIDDSYKKSLKGYGVKL